MKVVHSDKPLPHKWGGMPLGNTAVLIADVFVSRHSRLRMKLLVFEKRLHMRRFAKAALNIHLSGVNTAGFCNALGHERLKVEKDGSTSNHRLVVDPRFFAVMCLCVDALGMEVITHEAGHAAFAYANRVKHKDLWPGQRSNDEEAICYPLGLIASRVNIALREAGLYERYIAACDAYKREVERKKKK